MPSDSVVLCNFGDASANHASAQTAINSACWAAYQQVPLPIVFICEDNGIGISTPTPKGWIAANFSQRASLKYFYCDGRDVLDCYKVSKAAAEYARVHRKPVFLHVRTVRLMGHAGSDAEIAYMSKEQIFDNETQDPLIVSAQQLIEARLMNSKQIIVLYQTMKARIAAIANMAVSRPKLQTVAQAMVAIIPPKLLVKRSHYLDTKHRAVLFKADKLALSKPLHMGKLLNLALTELMARLANIVVCGEDVGKKEGFIM